MPETNRPEPRCLTLILCDYLVIDQQSHKPTLVGCTQHVEVPGFPVFAGPYWFFCEFTNGHGTFEFALRVVDPDEQVLFQQRLAIPMNNPLETANLAMQVPGFMLRRAGAHRVELVDTAGLPLIDRRLHIYPPGTRPQMGAGRPEVR